MCTVDTLQQMSDINSNIIRLYSDRLNAIGRNDVLQLRILPIVDKESNSKRPVQQAIPESTQNKLNDTFRMVLLLLQTNDANVFSVGKEFLDSLKEIMIGFPSYSKIRMGEDTRELYEKSKSVLKEKASSDLINSLISCKEAIFKD